jgi:hypothetical protein
MAVPKPDDSEGPKNGITASIAMVVQRPSHRPHFLRKNNPAGGTTIAANDTAARGKKMAGFDTNGGKAPLAYAAASSSETNAGK